MSTLDLMCWRHVICENYVSTPQEGNECLLLCNGSHHLRSPASNGGNCTISLMTFFVFLHALDNRGNQYHCHFLVILSKRLCFFKPTEQFSCITCVTASKVKIAEKPRNDMVRFQWSHMGTLAGFSSVGVVAIVPLSLQSVDIYTSSMKRERVSPQRHGERILSKEVVAIIIISLKAG